jgi:hypothetical protein
MGRGGGEAQGVADQKELSTFGTFKMALAVCNKLQSFKVIGFNTHTGKMGLL